MTDLQPQAAALLRNAALVLEHAGHATNDYVDNYTGTVCLEGALRVAAGNGLRTIRNSTNSTNTPAPFRFGIGPYPDYGSPLYAAEEALISILPDRCHEHPSYTECGYCDSDRVLDPSTVRIHHFNDFVCRGGEEAQLVLIQAAEKIEANLP